MSIDDTMAAIAAQRADAADAADDDPFWEVELAGSGHDCLDALVPDREEGCEVWGHDSESDEEACVIVKDVVVAGTAITIQEVVNDGVLSNVGGELWEAAELLGQVLTDSGAMQDRHVVEVGAGLGLLGFLAARRGARSVALTDGVPALIRNLERSVAANANRHGPWECAEPPRVFRLDWTGEWGRGQPTYTLTYPTHLHHRTRNNNKTSDGTAINAANARTSL